MRRTVPRDGRPACRPAPRLPVRRTAPSPGPGHGQAPRPGSPVSPPEGRSRISCASRRPCGRQRRDARRTTRWSSAAPDAARRRCSRSTSRLLACAPADTAPRARAQSVWTRADAVNHCPHDGGNHCHWRVARFPRSLAGYLSVCAAFTLNSDTGRGKLWFTREARNWENVVSVGQTAEACCLFSDARGGMSNEGTAAMEHDKPPLTR